MTSVQYSVAHDDSATAEVPRWVRRLAHAVALLTLPSGLWRVALVVGVPVTSATVTWQPLERLYVLSLSLVCEGLALLTLGLVRPWGEVVPSWIPLLGGRRVPPFAAIVPATVGAAMLTVLWTATFVGTFSQFLFFRGTFFDHFDATAQKVAVAVCYAPLLAWGPLLGVVTLAYYRRRVPQARRTA